MFLYECIQIERAQTLKKWERRVNSPALIVGDVDRRNLPFAVVKLRVAGSLLMDFSWKAQPIKEKRWVGQHTKYLGLVKHILVN